MRGIVSLAEALAEAERADLDLVQVADGDPPTCRLLDYSKQRYLEQQRAREQRRRSLATQQEKTLKLRTKIAAHDYETKLRAARSWLAEGARVQVVVQMRGRERAHPELALALVNRIAGELGSNGAAASQARLTGATVSASVVPAARKPETADPQAELSVTA